MQIPIFHAGRTTSRRGSQARPNQLSFAQRLLTWWDEHGRHDLPWQTSRTPYRVWVAEIMLQQTQVSTVIPYFRHFMDRFPDLEALASAELDEVLALWSGLGYYARARNLHRAATMCAGRGGRLPDDLETLLTLPGIGPSTASAILSQAHNRRHAILDGNVKRLLARHAGIDGWPGKSAIEKRLWRESETRLPDQDPEGRFADHTQAIMDLGATVCKRAKPACPACPVRADCRARREGRVAELPTPRPRRKLRMRETTMLIMLDKKRRLYLVRRPPAGIWGGLWCLPEASGSDNLLRDSGPLGTTEHAFTHFRLKIEFRHTEAAASEVNDSNGRWLTPDQALAMGLPQPVRRFLKQSRFHLPSPPKRRQLKRVATQGSEPTSSGSPFSRG